jgi:hypothetical protein
MMRVPFLLLLLLPAIPASSTAQDASPKAIKGVWRGTSICVNLEAAPACKNEEVIYEFRETTPPVSGKLNLNADKIVDGKAVPMGEFEVVWVPAEGAWSSEIQTPRVHALWSFKQPKSDELAGTLVLLPDRTLIRKAAAHRARL